MMARVELPESRFKARRRRSRLRASLFVLGMLILVLGGLVALARASFLRITAVAISGTETVATSSVAGVAQEHLAGYYFYFVPKGNIFLYPNEDIKEALLYTYPQIKSVDIHVADFHTVVVSVTERHTTALWCASAPTTTPAGKVLTGCYTMDEDGVVYAPAREGVSAGEYISYSGGLPGRVPWHYLDSDEFSSLSALVGALSQAEAGDRVQQVVVTESGDVLAYFQNNFLLLFTLTDEGGDVFERLGLALKSDPFKGKKLGDFEYLDLRFGDKLYYKLK